VGIKTFLEGPGNSHGAGNEMPAAGFTIQRKISFRIGPTLPILFAFLKVWFRQDW
jgi:hypothetical protein